MESTCYTPVIRLTWYLKTGMPKDDGNGVAESFTLKKTFFP